MFDLPPEKQNPLSQYVIAVLVVWAAILAGVWVFDRERFATFAHVCGGFLLGMCAMYIAMHLYRIREGSRNRCTYPAMRKLEEFVSKERERFSIKDNNIFAFSFGKVTRRWMFLEIIREHYRGASAAFVANSEAMRATYKPGGPHLLTADQLALQSEGVRLSTIVHLEIESFYLFAKIFLDDIARAIENYFGPARGLALDSHDDLEKSLERYAAAKGLLIPSGLSETISDLRKRVADFRDQEIAHEKSPRTMRGLTWGPDGEASFISTRLYPKESDKQTNSESLDGLASAFEEYVTKVIDFLMQNSSKARFEPAEDTRVSGGG